MKKKKKSHFEKLALAAAMELFAGGRKLKCGSVFIFILTLCDHWTLQEKLRASIFSAGISPNTTTQSHHK